MMFLLAVQASPAHAGNVGGHTAQSVLPATGPGTSLNKQALARFVGKWFAHSSSVTVHTTGLVTVLARAYTWCGATVKPPCDVIKGNDILSGVRVSAHIHTITGTLALAVVTASAIPHTVGTALTLQLVPPAHLLTHARTPWLNHLYLCSASYFLHGKHSQQSASACG
jgi:hypothetical protein